MITASTKPDYAGLAAVLERKARALGEAHAETVKLRGTAPEQVWRQARLLWPLFTKG